MLKKIALTILTIFCILVFLGGTKVLQIQAMIAAGAHQTMPPEVVTSADVKPDTWENFITATGTAAAVQGVTVGAEMPGKVVKIAFESGAKVNAGDLLVQLETSSEQAQLQAAEAAAALSKTNLDRAKELREKNTNSQAELDASDAQFKQATAAVENIRAVINKKTIRAPFAGRLGLRLVNLGQVLKEGEAITTLQTLDPIYVNFSIPQQRLSVIQAGTAVRVTSDSAPDKTFEGKVNAVSPEVDTATRNARIQATLSNTDEQLRPGMFVNVAAVLHQSDKVLAIPVSSVLYAPYGDSVFVIEEKKDEKSQQMQKVIRQQFVRLGQSRGDFVAIVDGLKEGQTVVSSGVFKLRSGMAVTIDNKLAPKAQLNPKPNDA